MGVSGRCASRHYSQATWGGDYSFVPDPSLTYAGLAKDNVRLAVRDDLLVQNFIRVSEEIVKVMNRGERAGQYGYVSVPVHEIQPLMDAKAFLGQSISIGLRDHSPCLCGSGAKYKVSWQGPPVVSPNTIPTDAAYGTA